MTLNPGTLLNNRYRIVSVLGQGGMGAVYSAMDEILNIPVAVKENLNLAEEYSRQFQREAQILANLRHPNLPRVGDIFTLPGQGQYLIMDFIEGEDLRQRIERAGTLSNQDVILVGASICDALEYLHSRQPPIIHRDIKPGNIKITPEREVILVDFGLVKLIHDNQATTTAARAMTPGYSPPEQYGTGRTDNRTDIYSLGATLYASLTGVIPEDGLDRVTQKAQLTPIRQFRPRGNQRLANVVEKAMAMEPDDRFQTASDLKKALLAAGELTAHFQEPIKISPAPGEEASLREASGIVPVLMQSLSHGKNRRKLSIYRHPALKTVGAVVLVAAAALWFFQFQSRFFPSNSRTEIPINKSNPIVNTTSPIVAPTQAQVEPLPTRTLQADLLIAVPTEKVVTPMGGGSSQIAFASDRSGIMQIFSMNVDGSNQTQLTSMQDGACQPAWSPDGSQIVFISPCQTKKDLFPGAGLYVMNSDGKDIKPLPIPPNSQGDFDPAWSPDGKRIAFTSLRDSGRPQIYTVLLSDYSIQNLSLSTYTDKQPTWSPSGMQLSFSRLVYNYQIWVMENNGRNQFQFSPSGGVNNINPFWAPNGQTVYYNQMSIDSQLPSLVGLNYEDRTKGLEIRIPAIGQESLSPVAKISLSPDGRWMAFESWPDGKNHDIYLATITGTNRIRLTTDRGMDFGAAWRP